MKTLSFVFLVSLSAPAAFAHGGGPAMPDPINDLGGGGLSIAHTGGLTKPNPTDNGIGGFGGIVECNTDCIDDKPRA